MLRKKIVLLPVHPPRIILLKKTLWCLSHIQEISVLIICHKCSNEDISSIKKYGSIIKNIIIIKDNTNSNLSFRLNSAMKKFECGTLFYRLDAGDIAHIDKFNLIPKKDELITHDAIIEFPYYFIFKKFKSFYRQLFMNELVHSSFIFQKLSYETKLDLAQDYHLSLKKIIEAKHYHINKLLVKKDMTVAGNTIHNKGKSIKCVIEAKKILLGHGILGFSVVIDYLKLIWLKLRI
jgi:hypothetical protein